MRGEASEYCNICENFPCLGNHPPEAGTLTPEIINRALDKSWKPFQSPPRPIKFSFDPDPGPELCRAKLFAPDESLVLAVRAELITTRTPVHPRDIPYLGPAQGPAPAVCAREPHPASPWHWDGRGTWFR